MVDGIDHQGERRVEDQLRFFGIALGDQFHRAFDVGEENGDYLPLARFCPVVRGDRAGPGRQPGGCARHGFSCGKPLDWPWQLQAFGRASFAFRDEGTLALKALQSTLSLPGAWTLRS